MCRRAEDSGGSYSSRSYDGDSRGGSSSDRFRGDSNDLVMQEDTIFVSGMPTHASEDDIKEHFGSIGVIKVREKCGCLIMSRRVDGLYSQAIGLNVILFS